MGSHNSPSYKRRELDRKVKRLAEADEKLEKVETELEDTRADRTSSWKAGPRLPDDANAQERKLAAGYTEKRQVIGDIHGIAPETEPWDDYSGATTGFLKRPSA